MRARPSTLSSMAFSWSALKRRSVSLAAFNRGCGLFSRGVVCLWLWVPPGVTGQNIPPAGIYPGLKRPRLDYTPVYYGLGQFIPRGKLWHRPIHTSSDQNIPHDINHDINSDERYTHDLFNFSTSY